MSQSSEELQVHISAIHIRLDLGIIMQDSGLLPFFEDLLTLQTRYNDQDLVSSQTTLDQHLQGNTQHREKPLEQVFLEDPDIHPAVEISPEDPSSNPVSHLIAFSRYH